MPKQSFAFEPGGEKRLEVSWKLLWKDVTVSLDGNVIGVIPNQRALSRGEEFQLPDGSTIKVQLVSTFSANELQILRNGQPLPGSVSDPQTKLKWVYTIVYYVAGINVVLGLLAFVSNSEYLQKNGIGFYSVLFGLVFIILGLFIQRKSSLALFLAMVILIIDGFAGSYFAALQGYKAGGSGIIARMFLLIPMFQGFSAIKVLKTKNA